MAIAMNQHSENGYICGGGWLFPLLSLFLLCVQPEVLGYLEKLCQLIPDESLAAECKEVVDDYFPVLVDIIKGELVSWTK